MQIKIMHLIRDRKLASPIALALSLVGVLSSGNCFAAICRQSSRHMNLFVAGVVIMESRSPVCMGAPDHNKCVQFGRIFRDHCATSKSVYKYFCDGGKVSFQILSCKGHGQCQHGACRAPKR